MEQTVRDAIKAAGLKQWEVARECGVSEYTLIRWLRSELSAERKKAIFAAIEALSQAGVSKCS